MQHPSLDLLGLPDAAISCVFSHLGLRDALRLSWTCKHLLGLSSQAAHQRYACARCKHPVFNPVDVFNSEAHSLSPKLKLQDGGTYVAEAYHVTGAVLSPEYTCDDWSLKLGLLCKLGRAEASETMRTVRVQSLTCGGCGLYLGLHLVQLGPHRLGHCNGSGLVLHATVLGKCWLPKKYLALIKADGSDDTERGCAGRVFSCTGIRSNLVKPGQCGKVLFEERAVLSKQHCWDAGSGVEKAWYINHFQAGAVEERNERKETLCQGDMCVADVHCTKCGGRIGWKFCSDHTQHENDNQVGRFGVCKSSFKFH